jgi:integrase
MRTIINNAIASEAYTAKYPFGKKGYEIPAPTSKKNPLTTNEFNALAAYKPQDQDDSVRQEKVFGRDMWLLCYYCGGRNYADILYLKYKDVTESTITFHVRQKTINTHENQKPLVVPIHDELREILDRHCQKNSGPDTFVLPVLRNGKQESLINLRSDFGKRCNEALALIAADLKIKAIKMQQSRHTALNELKRQNRSREEIRVIAGHASDKTTELYLESLNADVVNDVLNSLRPKKSNLKKVS